MVSYSSVCLLPQAISPSMTPFYLSLSFYHCSGMTIKSIAVILLSDLSCDQCQSKLVFSDDEVLGVLNYLISLSKCKSPSLDDFGTSVTNE